MEMPKGVKRLPNPVWTPFDTNVSPLYEILYFLLVCSQVLTVFGNGYYDFAYGSATQHLCAQLLLLKEQLKNITVGIMPHASDLEKFHSGYFQKRVMERLKICVRHHCRLLKYGKNLDKYSSSILLLQLLMSYLAMVINGYILTSNKADTLQTVEICSYTMTIFTEFVVFSVQASDLKDQSITVVDAVALSEWYLFKAPIKKALALLTMNAEKSIVITVGGMLEADNSLIIEVVLKAFSAITLLKALTIEEG
ncbi:uncharacterized protein LOC108914449 [Anoplophora glabripennis]|uniref:uncharacterized protein LOC108914449 n=1 Tax=Anoplophora glabripennis TaxID=217634 RepID=UPI000C77C9E2|nr:uncharacterized protein LOC108914449 [Anoplophora glabripennis]